MYSVVAPSLVLSRCGVDKVPQGFEATSDELKAPRAEARQLKEALAELTLENRLLKKSVL